MSPTLALSAIFVKWFVNNLLEIGHRLNSDYSSSRFLSGCHPADEHSTRDVLTNANSGSAKKSRSGSVTSRPASIYQTSATWPRRETGLAMPVSCCRFYSERVDGQLSHISGSGRSIEICEVLFGVVEPWYTCVSNASADRLDLPVL